MKITADRKVFSVIDDVASLLYSTASKFPGGDRYGLSTQIRKTAVTMTTSVAESYSAVRDEDILASLRSARNSLRALQNQIGLAQRLGYIDDLRFAVCDQKSVEADTTLQQRIAEVGAQN